MTRRRPPPILVWRIVAEFYGVNPNQHRINESLRSRVVNVRRVGMAMLTELCGMSLEESAEWFGHHHSSAVRARQYANKEAIGDLKEIRLLVKQAIQNEAWDLLLK